MLTIKNSAAALCWSLGLAAAALSSGCTPSGPKALLQGERLIQEGRFSEAIERLNLAVQLLPDNAQTWNHLGIALHSAGQMKEAARVYREALRRNPNLNAAHYNLGLLSLDQNDLPTAINELTTYVVLQRDSADGWLKLGTAQLHLHQLDAAEKSFQNTLRLKSGLPEALNGLGVVHAQKKHTRDAVACFSAALRNQPDYAAALLNLAVVTQPFDRSGAMRQYRRYLSVAPNAPNAIAVRDLVQQFERESAAKAQVFVANHLPLPSQPPSVTNALAARPATLPLPDNAVSTAPLPSTRTLPPVTNAAGSATAAVAHAPPVPLKGAEQITLSAATAKNDASSLRPAAPAPVRQSVPARTQEREIPQKLTAPQEPPPKLAVDVASAASTNRSEPQTQTAPSEDSQSVNTREFSRTTHKEEKRTLAQRLNPTTWFRGREKPAPITTPLDAPLSSKPTTRPASQEKLVAKMENTPTTTPTPKSRTPMPATTLAEEAVAPRPMAPRYSYRSPAKPLRGDRAHAEQALARGVQAHAQRDLSAAQQAYREATGFDPSLFEAQYNLGLAAYELKNWPLSLSSYETALSINPTSDNARFNFALALDRAGYRLDAAAQLEKLLGEHPQEVRAHFAAAQIYAEGLQQLDAAALHYRRVLDLEPQHPQAAAIRQWLVAHDF